MNFFCVFAAMSVALGVGGAEVSSKGDNSAKAVKPPSKLAVFTSGQEGYHTFRIPAIVVSGKGTLLAFCEGRRGAHGDTGDIDTVLKRSFDGGLTWGPLQVIWDDGPHVCGNPCPVVDRTTGTIWLHSTRNDGRDHQRAIDAGTSREPRTAWVTKSTDDGATWSKPIDISPMVRKPHWRWYGTGPCNAIQTRSGRLVIPTCYSAWVEKDGKGFANYYPNVIYSDDHGKTWQTGGTAGDSGSEATLAELSDGSLMINVRNWPHLTRGRGVAVSKDGGLSWSEPTIDEVLIDSGCQASLISYTSRPTYAKNRLLFSNPASLSPRRHKLTVRLSYDDGKTWPVARLIHAGYSAYSNLVVLPDVSLGCLYEAGKPRGSASTIDFAAFTLDWLTDGEDTLQRR
ncbi:MAG: exo-alpha-sialidase [Pirellulaceae bacterium]